MWANRLDSNSYYCGNTKTNLNARITCDRPSKIWRIDKKVKTRRKKNMVKILMWPSYMRIFKSEAVPFSNNFILRYHKQFRYIIFQKIMNQSRFKFFHLRRKIENDWKWLKMTSTLSLIIGPMMSGKSDSIIKLTN